MLRADVEIAEGRNQCVQARTDTSRGAREGEETGRGPMSSVCNSLFQEERGRDARFYTVHMPGSHDLTISTLFSLHASDFHGAYEDALRAMTRGIIELKPCPLAFGLR